MKKILLLSSLLLTSISLAQMDMRTGPIGAALSKTPGMDHSKTPMTGSSTAGSSMNMSPNMGMSDLGKLSGKAFDRAFLSMMIPHHQAALDMSKAVLPLSKDATVQKWAKAIISAQQSEIAQMNALLKSYGGSDNKMARVMDPMKSMGEKVRASKTPDQTFVQDMVGHHASAIEMGNLALQKSSNSSVLKLARNIVTAQAGEMYDFQTWLMKR